MWLVASVLRLQGKKTPWLLLTSWICEGASLLLAIDIGILKLLVYVLELLLPESGLLGHDAIVHRIEVLALPYETRLLWLQLLLIVLLVELLLLLLLHSLLIKVVQTLTRGSDLILGLISGQLWLQRHGSKITVLRSKWRRHRSRGRRWYHRALLHSLRGLWPLPRWTGLLWLLLVLLEAERLRWI